MSEAGDRSRMVALTVRVTQAERDAFKAYCAAKGRTMSAVLRDYIDESGTGSDYQTRDEEVNDG